MVQHDNARLTIGEVAAQTGLSAATLRYYEKLGLIAPAGRRGLTRLYDAPAILERLEIVRLAGAIGFTLEETRTLLARVNDRPAFEELAHAKLAELELRRQDLAAAAQLLRHTLVCDCGSVGECFSASAKPPNLRRSAHRAARSRRAASPTR